jgi:hypothetical protein
MTGTTLDVRRFRDSRSRAVASVDVRPRFSDRFVAGSPETASLFQGRDLSRIQSKLKVTLDLVNNNVGAQAGLGMCPGLLGRLHGGMNIVARMGIGQPDGEGPGPG